MNLLLSNGLGIEFNILSNNSRDFYAEPFYIL